MNKTILHETMTFNKNIIMNPYDYTLTDADGDNKRASGITFKGKDSLGSEGSLASIITSHSGTSTDHKGKIKFNVNDGSSTNNLHNIMTIGPAEIKNSGALQSATNDTVTLVNNVSTSIVDDFYNNYNLKITSGNGKGQIRKIIDYVGSTKIATLESNWTTNPSADDKYEILSSSVSIIGDLNVSSIISSTNTTISDNMIELNSGLTGANTHDSGILIERGTTGDNAFMGWDESEERFILGTTTAINTDTGNLTITPSPLEISNLFLKTDSSVLSFGADSDTTLTHTDGLGITLNSTNKLCFRDNAIHISSDADGYLNVQADTGVNININGTDELSITSTNANFGTNITTSGITATGTLNTSILNTSGAVTITGNGATITGGGDNNVFLGNIPTGLGSATNNVGVGVGSLNGITGTDNTVGIQNTAIGYNAGNSITTGTNNTCIGYESDTSSAIIQNEFTLGNGSVTTLRCADQTIASLSDGRDKKNIVDSTYGLDFVNSLRPVQFTWDKRVLVDGDETFSKNGRDEIGFIAQEFQSVMPNNENDVLDLVYESNPDRLEARYGKLIPILTKAIQDLSGIVKELNEKIKKLESTP